ncbi:MAG: hypothetical protein P8K66_11950 [Planctomycetota bacterium]|nr:hypothetical protein [Planctomycetota bacterium]
MRTALCLMTLAILFFGAIGCKSIDGPGGAVRDLGDPALDPQEPLEVLVPSEEIPFVDKAAKAKPHTQSRGLYSDKFPDTVLIDQDGNKHKFYSDLIKDRMAVIQFFYTTCNGI